MTGVTIALCLSGLGVLFVAYANGVGAIHGASVTAHMYWATAALVAVAAGDFIAVAHLARAARIIRELRALCDRNGIRYGDA